MSRPITDNIDCPQCRAAKPFVRWQSLNVTLDPERKAELLDGRLTRFTCDACGHSANVAYSLLYHDMLQQYMVWLIPPDPDGTAVAPDFDTSGTVGRLAKRADGKYRFRRVDSLNELREKVYVFDAGLDDRLVEVAKILVAAKAVPGGLKTADTQIFFRAVKGEGEAAAMTFAVVRANQQSEISATRNPMVRTLRDSFGATWDADRSDGWLRIDGRYAMGLMRQGSTAKASTAGDAPPAPRRAWWKIWG